MCQFPSWIQHKGEVLFLTDKDVPRGANVYDYVGHHAIKNLFGRKFPLEQHEEGFPCHPKVAKAIRNGQMRRLSRADGYTVLSVDTKGRLHGKVRVASGRWTEEWHYMRGKLQGMHRWWKDGKLKYKAEYKNGDMVSEKFFN